MAPRRKQPNNLETKASTAGFLERMQWLTEEYKLLAVKRNTFAFLYNEALKRLGGDKAMTPEMLGWRKEALRIETIMQWIAETYHAQANRSLVQSKMKLD